MTQTAVPLIASLLSLCGLAISVYLWHKKKLLEKPFCPLRMDCAKVITSKHSMVLGVPVELLGLGYYASLFAFYAIPLAFGVSLGPVPGAIALLATVGAALFSIYLLSIQAFAIRGWCSWCIGSAIVSILLAVLAVWSVPSEVLVALYAGRGAFVALHVFGLVIGMGAAFVGDSLFLTFLKDRKISEEESSALERASGMVWAGLAVAIVTGFATFLPLSDVYLSDARFLAKMTAVFVIAVNGIALNVAIAPRLVGMRFGGDLAEDAPMRRRRRLAFALGSVSAVSWISAFALAMAKGIPYPYGALMLFYGMALLIGILGSRVLEQSVSREA